jgi:dihydroneopterin aldolase/2-amino-4-hydroxy-6-hydroxymethyldihydropteridine diphosphokinase
VARAFVGIGSNIEPAENVEKAIYSLSAAVQIRAISTVYLTEAVGRPGQPPYYNCVVELETDVLPVELKQQVLRRIEQELGRIRNTDRYAARTIDLDLILYDQLVMTTEGLTLPDPDIVKRPFLAIPLQELAPDLKLPGSDLRISEIAAALPQDAMKPLQDYTARLRKGTLHERKQ